MDDAATLELAKRLRAELPSLLSTEEPGELGAITGELADLIERGEAGEPVTIQILRLLRGQPILRQRANELVKPMSERTGVIPPPGGIRVPLGPRYVCPNGDFEFFRRDVSQLVPTCPHDGANLILENPA